MAELITRPTRNHWIACVIAFPSLTATGAVVPLIALLYFAADLQTGRVPWWGLIASLLFGAGLAAWFLHRTIHRQCWRLTGEGARTTLTLIARVVRWTTLLTAILAGWRQAGRKAWNVFVPMGRSLKLKNHRNIRDPMG